MIQKLVDNMEFTRRPVDPDNPERGEEILARVMLMASKDIDPAMEAMSDSTEDLEDAIKAQLVMQIHQFLYSEFKAELRQIGRNVANLERACRAEYDSHAEQFEELEKLKDKLYKLMRTLQGRQN